MNGGRTGQAGPPERTSDTTVPVTQTSAVIKLELLLGVVWFAVWVFTIIDVLSANDGAIRRLPKLGWLFIVAFFQVVGVLAWYVLGRPEGNGQRGLSSYERSTPAFPEYDRPGRVAATDPEKDEDFLRQVRARAEEQRRRHEQDRRARERERDAPPAAEES